jgi:hypothetical protein
MCLNFPSAFVCGRGGRFTVQKRRLPAPRAAACLVHGLLLQKVTSPRFTTLKRRLQGPLAGPFTSVCSELAIPGDKLDQRKHSWLGIR